MPDYSFETLSPIDFEHLARDLIQAELKIRLESFKSGKDGGIDFRYSPNENNILIVQVKHYVNTGLKGLINKIRKDEKPKVDKLKPTKYLLITSLPLSPADKDEIKTILSPHVKLTGDIYGKDDLNNLLEKHKDIERNNFKLWLSSIPILEEVLHSRITNQNKFALESIHSKARIYVMNDSFKKAQEILKQYNYVVIAGIPGIGKSTLAQMLVLNYIKHGFEFINISNDIEDAYSTPDYAQSKIYLYDDFLGQTSLTEKLHKKEDSRLFHFISRLRDLKSAKLILTTREYILRQAQQNYELLDNPLFDTPQCIIDLSLYTRKIRAEILYNHMFFSKLSSEYTVEIIRQRTYLKIIDHPNYSPRVIEYMTDPMWIKDCLPSNYPDLFLKNLREPFLIWEKAFDSQISEIAQDTLLILGTLPREVFLDDLKYAVIVFFEAKKKNITDKEFENCISELEGNFVKTNQVNKNELIIEFHNPSIQDFIETYVSKNSKLYATLAKNAIFFEQIEWIMKEVVKINIQTEVASYIDIGFRRTIESKPCRPMNYGFALKGREHLNLGKRLRYIATLTAQEKYSFLRNLLLDSLDIINDQVENNKIENNELLLLLNTINALSFIDENYINTLLVMAKDAFYRNMHWLPDASCILEFFETYPKLFNVDEDYLKIANIIEELIVDTLGYSDNLEVIGEGLAHLSEIEEEYHFGFDSQLDSLREILSSLEDGRPEEIEDDSSYMDRDESEDIIADDSVDDMFLTLLE